VRTDNPLRRLPIRYQRLKNGLEVLVVKDRSSPVVSVQVWYRVGSRYDPPGLTGISHFLEHLMFKGTQKYKPEEYSLIIQRMGGMNNAFTFEDATVYVSEVPSFGVETVLEMEADRLRNLKIRDFEQEKKVVMEERRRSVDNDPFGLLYEHLRAVTFLIHPYKHPIIGWMADLERMTPEDVKHHYTRYYRLDNAFLVLAGDIDLPEAIQKVNPYFGKLKPGEHLDEKPPLPLEEPPMYGPREVVVEKPGVSPILACAYPIPAFKSKEVGALEVLSRILSSGESSRLYRSLVYEKQMATDASGDAKMYQEAGLFYFFLFPRPDTAIPELKKALQEEISRLQKSPVEPWELEKAKNQVIAEWVFGQDGCLYQGFFVGMCHLMDHYRRVHTLVEEVQKVTAEDVLRVAQTYLSESRRTTGTFNPLPVDRRDEG